MPLEHAGDGLAVHARGAGGLGHVAATALEQILEVGPLKRVDELVFVAMTYPTTFTIHCSIWK